MQSVLTGKYYRCTAKKVHRREDPFEEQEANIDEFLEYVHTILIHEIFFYFILFIFFFIFK